MGAGQPQAVTHNRRLAGLDGNQRGIIAVYIVARVFLQLPVQCLIEAFEPSLFQQGRHVGNGMKWGGRLPQENQQFVVKTCTTHGVRQPSLCNDQA